ARLSFPSLTSYDHPGGLGNQLTLKADGAGSVLDLSHLTSVTHTGAGGSSDLFIQATAGGRADLSGLAAITAGVAQFTADGAGSVVDLSTLATFNDTVGVASSKIEARNAGTIVGNKLTNLN